MACKVKVCATSVQVKTTEASALFGGGAVEEVKTLIGTLEADAFDFAGLPKASLLGTLFPKGGWISISGEDSHFVPGQIAVPDRVGFHGDADRNDIEVCVLVEFEGGRTVELLKKVVTRYDFGRATRRAVLPGQFDRYIPFDKAGLVLMMSATKTFGDKVDVSAGANRVSAVGMPWSSNTYRGAPPPRDMVADVKKVSVALSENDLALLFSALRDSL